MQVLICLTLWTIWTFSSHAYHHCSSSSAGTLLTDGNLHQLIINVDTKRIKNYLEKWKVSLKLQTDINMKITNNTTIYIPKNPLHLFSARELCRSMDSNPCSLPITMTILEEENVEYFTNYKLATDRESIFCVFSSYDITIDNVCLFQLGKMKEEYQLQGIPIDKASIIKLLGSNDEGIVTVTKISSKYFMGLSVDTKGVILPCCTTTPSQTEAEILLQGHFQEKLEKTERKLSRIEHHMTQTSNRKKRSLWSFLGIASENEVITLNTNVMNNFDSLKSQGLAITEVSNSQKDITKQLNEEATVLNALNNREQNLNI